jgi:transposase
MARKKRSGKPLLTIWEVNDGLWNIIQDTLDGLDPAAPTGRPWTRKREALNGIVHQVRTDGQWNQLPQSFGDDSSVHRTMQQWAAMGILKRIWAVLMSIVRTAKVSIGPGKVPRGNGQGAFWGALSDQTNGSREKRHRAHRDRGG